MTGELDYVKVEVLRGHDLDDHRQRFYINVHFNDNTDIIMDDRFSHAEAIIAALEYGVPVHDYSRR